MSGLEIFVFIIVPVTVGLVCVAGLWLQARANKAVQADVKRLDELNAAPDPFEQPISGRPATPIRAAGQFILPLDFTNAAVSVLTEMRGAYGEAGADFMRRSSLAGFTMRVQGPILRRVETIRVLLTG